MTVRHDEHQALRARLRAAAGAHQPDRARMLARVERGMAGSAGRGAARPPVRGWVRVAGATAAVAGVLAVGGYAVAAAVRAEAPADRAVAVSAPPGSTPTPTPSPDATARPPAGPTPRTSPAAGAPKSTASPTAPATPSTASSAPVRPPAASGVEDGPLWSDGSVDPHSNEFWAQSNVTLKTDRPLTAVTVRLRIAQTGGVTSTGAWRSLPENDFALTVAERDGFLVYTWKLKRGRTVPAGTWVFAGQYDHERGGRDAGADSYAATATAATGDLSVAGDFAPQRDGD
ncbi:hypothetical protein [Streptomyces sp. JW3]|uniref:hypothetical protein n=1 Tax=Streptomyces sp. JW3 TaxID=3456955 RepID=UPI003FA49147